MNVCTGCLLLPHGGPHSPIFTTLLPSLRLTCLCFATVRVEAHGNKKCKIAFATNVPHSTLMCVTVTAASIVHGRVIPDISLSLIIVSAAWIGANSSASEGCISGVFTASVSHSHHFSPGRESEYMDRLSGPSSSVCTLSGRLPPTAFYLMAHESLRWKIKMPHTCINHMTIISRQMFLKAMGKVHPSLLRMPHSSRTASWIKQRSQRLRCQVRPGFGSSHLDGLAVTLCWPLW